MRYLAATARLVLLAVDCQLLGTAGGQSCFIDDSACCVCNRHQTVVNGKELHISRGRMHLSTRRSDSLRLAPVIYHDMCAGLKQDEEESKGDVADSGIPAGQ